MFYNNFITDIFSHTETFQNIQTNISIMRGIRSSCKSITYTNLIKFNDFEISVSQARIGLMEFQ